MNLKPEEITIAVTVYNRRDYLQQSIGSALSQTVPVRVMVVEDCGPDPELERHIRQQFGGCVEYRRNPLRRGIFGNWNACMEWCQTKWISILHDDDYLEPNFVSAMLDLANGAGERGLYFGQTVVIDSKGNRKSEWDRPALPKNWMPVTLEEVLHFPPFSFPGQLFQVAAAQKMGGFRETSLFCGEWELWTKIIAHFGAAQTAETVAVFRAHDAWDRGTNRLHRSGKMEGLVSVQRRRNLALAQRFGRTVPRMELKQGVRTPIPTKYMLQNARYFSPLYLAYNSNRFVRTPAPNWSYRFFQLGTRIGKGRFWKTASQIWGVLKGMPK